MLQNLLYKYFHSIHKPKYSPTTHRKLCKRKNSTQLLNILEDDAFAITHQPYSWYMLGLDDNAFQGYFVVKMIAAPYLSIYTVSPGLCGGSDESPVHGRAAPRHHYCPGVPGGSPGQSQE